MSGKAVAALIVAVALLAGGGSATAAKLITGKQIKDGSITGRDIRNDSIRPDDVHISVYDDILSGAPTVAGPAGPAGPVGVANITVARARTDLCSNTISCAVGSARAICPTGTKPVSGGGVAVADRGLFMSLAMSNGSEAQGWVAGADNYGGFPSGAYVEAYAYCSAQVTSFPLGPAMRSSRQAGLRVEQQRALRSAMGTPAPKAQASACVKARIGGARKCLQRGQFCAPAYKKQYRRYGFRCVKRNGRYRLA